MNIDFKAIVDNFLNVVRNNFFNLNGRAGRREYWFFALVVFIVTFILGILTRINSSLFLLTCVWAAFIIMPSWAAAVRRLHDTSRSGWWILIKLVPVIGSIALIILLAMPSTPGPNQYGEVKN